VGVMREFISSFAEGRPPAVTGIDGRAAVEICEAACCRPIWESDRPPASVLMRYYAPFAGSARIRIADYPVAQLDRALPG